MSKLLLGTNTVRLDEACFSLKELNEPTPDSKHVDRWQIIRVIRQDRVAEFRRSLGRAKKYKAEQIVIPGGIQDVANGRIIIDYTVGELMDAADYLRSDQYDRPEQPRSLDLVQGYRDLPDKRRRARRAVSQFGPVAVIQRG